MTARPRLVWSTVPVRLMTGLNEGSASRASRAAQSPAKRASSILGRLVARLWTLRQMSVAVAGMMQGGKSPAIEAALVKDLK